MELITQALRTQLIPVVRPSAALVLESPFLAFGPGRAQIGMDWVLGITNTKKSVDHSRVEVPPQILRPTLKVT